MRLHRLRPIYSLPLVALSLGCGRPDPLEPAIQPGAAVMLGEWRYAATPVGPEVPSLNAGLHVEIAIDSVDGVRFRGRVTLWFAGDVGVPLESFGPVSGEVGESGSVSFVVPMMQAEAPPITVIGIVSADALVIGESRRGLDPGPFERGERFRRASAALACAPPSASLPASAAADSLVGLFRLSLVAQAGPRAGQRADGWLALIRADTLHYGSAGVDLKAVGALESGDLASADPRAPGVLVFAVPGNIMLRLGADANRTDQIRFEGTYTVLRVRELDGNGFRGVWASGAIEEVASGFFCATTTARGFRRQMPR